MFPFKFLIGHNIQNWSTAAGHMLEGSVTVFGYTKNGTSHQTGFRGMWTLW